MFKIPKWAKILTETVGKWWALMSGIISIPIAAIGYIVGPGNERNMFVILAFCALWVLVFTIGWKNYELINAQKKASNIAAKKQEIRREFTRLHGELRIVRQLIEMDMNEYQRKFEAAPDPGLHEIFSQIHRAFIKYFDGSKYVLFEDDSGFPTLDIKQRGTAMAEKTIHRLNQYIIRLGKIVEDNE
jgi:hypothetical protein